MSRPAHPRQYVCLVCSRRFRRADYLQRHQLNHDAPRFHCSQMGCGMTFYRKDVLQRHRALHCKKASTLLNIPGTLSESTLTLPSSLIEDSNPMSIDMTSSTNQYHDIHLYPESTTSLNTQQVLSEPDDSLQHLTQNVAGDLFMTPSLATEFDTQGFSPDQLQSFVKNFIIYNMRRLPFLHESHFAEGSLTPAIYTGVLAAGAAHSLEHRKLSLQLHRLSVQLGPSKLKLNSSCLEDLQYEALAIDFALSCRDMDLQSWATTELRHVWTFLEPCLNELLTCEIGSSNWSQWRRREELKRTIYSLFILSVAVASTRDVAPVIHATSLAFDMPCADALWDSSDAMAWARVNLQSQPNQPPLQFIDILHSFFSGDTERIYHQQSTSSFGSYILICAILETLQSSNRLPLRYMSVSHPTNLDLYSVLKDNVKSATFLWREKWWSDLSLLWCKAPNSLCVMEASIVLEFINVCLEQGHTTMGKFESVNSTTCARAAIEIFCGLSDIGFFHTSIIGSHLFGSFSFRATVAIANAMLEWVSYAFVLAGQNLLTREDLEELQRVRQAAHRGICEESLEPELGCFDINTHLPHIVAELWSIALSSHQLWDPRLRHEFGQHISIHQAQEASYLLSAPLFL
ncbi:hypothetical protein FDECE_17740 [Fusarium decemcellulare]|nr:hypothetical protein FDECE_17740 [Fusarium decemcellulare]